MSQPVPTTFDRVLLAIQAQLMTVLGWPEERVLLDAEAEQQTGEYAGGGEIHPQADQYVRVRWHDSGFDAANWEGQGRIAPEERVRVSAEVWTQLLVDDVNNAAKWLTERTLGHARARHDVINGMAGFLPEDSDGNWLVVEPIKPKSGRRPRRKRGGDGWGASAVDFEVTYVLDLVRTAEAEGGN